MIRHLHIRNYALIESLEIDFDEGFITITGETGAGKSILMGALALILGNRAEASALLNKEKKCVVEGEFIIAASFQRFFEEHELDYEKHSFLRREILPSGKSRAFINDTPVTLQVLKALGDHMVDIHSQHQSLSLGDHLYQMEVLDHVAGNEDLLRSYQANYSGYIKMKARLKAEKEEVDRSRGELDFYEYQLKELEEAKLKGAELQELEAEMKELEHAEEIKLALLQADDLIAGEERVLSMLSEAISGLRKNVGVHGKTASFVERLDSVYIELKDCGADMHDVGEMIEYDAGKLESVKGRVDLIYGLMTKHKRDSEEALLALRDELSEKVEKITFSDERLKKTELELKALYESLLEIGTELRKRRLAKVEFVESEILTLLLKLGMPNASFKVSVEALEEPGRFGRDVVKFLFSANSRAKAEELSKVASGGEMSRVMLSVKSLLSGYKGLPTLIFDEIDTGVSGEIAEKMGGIMKDMAGGRQVIAITHLPQVASQGGEHFLVYKEDDGSSTSTHLKKLSSEERVVEIAKLLSGEQISDAALSNARELLKV
jgi:DNA repair protein RecN (Recombination protein N)